jgi:CRP/FNR family cyclic AMP-dependent transcriptional regulator
MEGDSVQAILDRCTHAPLHRFADQSIIFAEGDAPGRVFVLERGAIEVLRGETRIALLDEPGSVIGEMSILLETPYLFTARAIGDTEARVLDDARAFFGAQPDIAWLVAKQLASRLNAAVTYIVDLKRQYAGSGNHLEMVGEVLESLLHHHERSFHPGSVRDPGLD